MAGQRILERSTVCVASREPGNEKAKLCSARVPEEKKVRPDHGNESE